MIFHVYIIIILIVCMQCYMLNEKHQKVYIPIIIIYYVILFFYIVNNYFYSKQNSFHFIFIVKI